ncbi:hypothetical protein LZ023_38030 (plasmid) [Pseudomonas silvicola]|nr:hypothetical protein LZ023_38030 [Pseudomonas silvicola]
MLENINLQVRPVVVPSTKTFSCGNRLYYVCSPGWNLSQRFLAEEVKPFWPRSFTWCVSGSRSIPLVLERVGLGLQIRGEPLQLKQRINAMLDRVGLKDFAPRTPHQRLAVWQQNGIGSRVGECATSAYS